MYVDEMDEKEGRGGGDRRDVCVGGGGEEGEGRRRRRRWGRGQEGCLGKSAGVNRSLTHVLVSPDPDVQSAERS